MIEKKLSYDFSRVLILGVGETEISLSLARMISSHLACS